jgi:hypothetical protein
MVRMHFLLPCDPNVLVMQVNRAAKHGHFSSAMQNQSTGIWQLAQSGSGERRDCSRGCTSPVVDQSVSKAMERLSGDASLAPSLSMGYLFRVPISFGNESECGGGRCVFRDCMTSRATSSMNILI